jgi:hypothetical protein
MLRTCERRVERSATLAPPSIQYGIGVHASSGIWLIARTMAVFLRAVTENATPWRRHADTMLPA